MARVCPPACHALSVLGCPTSTSQVRDCRTWCRGVAVLPPALHLALVWPGSPDLHHCGVARGAPRDALPCRGGPVNSCSKGSKQPQSCLKGALGQWKTYTMKRLDIKKHRKAAEGKKYCDSLMQSSTLKADTMDRGGFADCNIRARTNIQTHRRQKMRNESVEWNGTNRDRSQNVRTDVREEVDGQELLVLVQELDQFQLHQVLCLGGHLHPVPVGGGQTRGATPMNQRRARGGRATREVGAGGGRGVSLFFLVHTEGVSG